MAKYEPKEVDVTICVDDTLCKGVESWAWYGLQPVNRLLKPGGTLIVTSREGPEAIIAMAHRKETPYQLSILKGTVSFSGLWVYKDDHTDVRILGAIAKILPDLFSLKSVQRAIVDEWKDELKATSAAKSYERTTSITVQPDQGNPEVPYKFDLPKWHEMGEGIAIPEHSRRTQNGRSHVSRARWIPARSQSHLQEIQHPNHAAGGEFRYLYQMHAVLAAVPGLMLRRDSGRFVRREHASLLRVRRVRGGLPGQGMRHHGQ